MLNIVIFLGIFDPVKMVYILVFLRHDCMLCLQLSSREMEQEEMEKLFTSLRKEVTAARQEASDLSHQVSNSAHLQQQLTRCSGY